MGLFIPQEKIWDMAYGGSSDEPQGPHWFGNLAWIVAGALCKLFWRYDVVGRENLRAFKDKSGLMLIGTHNSYLDVAFYYLPARPSQWARIMGRDTLFAAGKGFGGALLSRCGGFPVKRDTADRTSIKRAVHMLKTGQIVIVFPEGTRRGKTEREPEVHAGAAFIAKMADVPILPCSVRNVEKIKNKGERPRFPKVTVSYGTPILIHDFDFLPKDERLLGVTWYALRECFALTRQCPPEAIDMVELFPSCKDFTPIFEEHPIPRYTTEEVIAMIQQKKTAKDGK